MLSTELSRRPEWSFNIYDTSISEIHKFYMNDHECNISVYLMNVLARMLDFLRRKLFQLKSNIVTDNIYSEYFLICTLL